MKDKLQMEANKTKFKQGLAMDTVRMTNMRMTSMASKKGRASTKQTMISHVSSQMNFDHLSLLNPEYKHH